MDGRIDLIVNTPYGNSGPRIDGYEIRSAAVARGHPVHHHRAGRRGGGAGHRGGDRGDGIGVRSLQDMHAALRKARS